MSNNEKIPYSWIWATPHKELEQELTSVFQKVTEKHPLRLRGRPDGRRISKMNSPPIATRNTASA